MQHQQMRLSQEQRLQMVLAPQLRQSLEMLQLPILELRSLIQQEMEKNPTLEEPPSDAPNIEIEPGQGEPEDKAEMDFDNEFEALAKLDDEWRSYFFQDDARGHYSRADSERRQFFLDSLPQKASLQQHLMSQLELAGLSETDHQVGELLVGSIDDDGYLTTTLEELSATASLKESHIADVLAIIQDFNPTGIGARDLRECLLLQLVKLGHADTLPSAIVSDHLDKLAAHKIQEIAQIFKVTPEEAQKATDIIGTLDPKPGRAYSTEVATYVLPEILVQKIEGEYVIILNDDQLPHVRISNHYRKLMRDKSTTPDVKEYIKNNVRAGVFLIKSIHQRQQTIFKIATEIVRVQTEFLDHGLAHLTPLTMSQVADVVGVHETTVSRAASGKYMSTPRGVFELKYFFTPGIKTTSGKDVSNTTVKDMLSTLVADEDPSHPLSDQELVAKLTEQGVDIARRTVAKYRLVLHIPPSHMRKSY